MADRAGSRIDLRTTIPLATRTLIRLARNPQRSWILPALTALVTFIFAILLLELMFYPGPVTALAYEGELRSHLVADYGSDPISARIQGLRLSIVDEVLGVQGDGEGGGQRVSDPVPTVTPEPTREVKPTAVPTQTPSEAPSETPTSEPTLLPGETLLPTSTPAALAGLDCSKLSFQSFWIHSDDELRAKVRNDLPHRAYLTNTVFDWPDVPAPAYVDWMRFDDDRYFTSPDDYASPTSAGSRVRIRRFSTEEWRVDFDDEPEGGIYGSFSLTLEFEVPEYGGSCTLNATTSKPIPATEVPPLEPSPTPTEVPPSATPLPSDTPLPSATPGPTDTPPGATDTPTVTVSPDVTASPTDMTTATPDPTSGPLMEPTEP